MSRPTVKRQQSDRPPAFQIWVRTVDDVSRLRLPQDTRLVVPWLNTDASRLDCVSAVGGTGGIIIAPAHSFETLRRPLSADLSRRTTTPLDSGSAWVAFARYLATAWEVPVAVEQSRFSLTLPEGARKLGLAPGSGEVAVVFAVGELLEVWRAESWLEHVRASAGSLDELSSAAIEALSESSEE